MNQHNPPPRGACRYGCQQVEAYTLMLYRDEDGNEEWIWNSRDAVTPFCITSRQGKEARHVDWQRDLFDPYHQPKVGDRIFMNLTMERAREKRRAFVDRFWDDVSFGLSMPERYGTKDAAIEQLAKADYESFGAGTSPDLVEVTEELLGILRSHRAPTSLPRPLPYCPPSPRFG